VDVCVKVAENLYAAAVNDPEREVFKVPAFMKQMVEKKWLGEKAGAGFYKKDGKEILHLDWKTPSTPAPRWTRRRTSRSRRPNQPVMAGKDKAAQFLWRVLSATLPTRPPVPEISD
jgi:3-hydroxyacyl-CoA dehydrogenase